MIGHPIYESHEQIMYIDQVLMPGGPKLTPKDPDDKALMEKWLDSGAMLKDEGTDWNGLSKRLGNLLSPMTLPLFAANIMNELTYWHFLETISMIPLVSNHFFMIMMFIFKFHGVEAFIKVNMKAKLCKIFAAKMDKVIGRSKFSNLFDKPIQSMPSEESIVPNSNHLSMRTFSSESLDVTLEQPGIGTSHF